MLKNKGANTLLIVMILLVVVFSLRFFSWTVADADTSNDELEHVVLVPAGCVAHIAGLEEQHGVTLRKIDRSTYRALSGAHVLTFDGRTMNYNVQDELIRPIWNHCTPLVESFRGEIKYQLLASKLAEHLEHAGDDVVVVLSKSDNEVILETLK